jgi:SAM-dependent methyltransferase
MVTPMNTILNKHPDNGRLTEQTTSLGLFEWIRFQFLKALYEFILLFLMRETGWKEPLFASLGPNAPCRVLCLGRGTVSTARTLALRLPDANVIGIDSRHGAVKRAFRYIVRNKAPNVTITEAPPCGPLPVETGCIDRAVLVLAFHNRIPEEKLRIAKEMLRVLKHGGMLHIAAYDKPSLPEERSLLALARYLSGPTAADPHLDGSWIKFLSKAGFAGIRRQASCPVVGARISVVRARKP